MKKLVIAALMMAMISGVSAQSTGAAPSFTNLGDVNPGETRKATLYVTSTYDEAYQISPKVEEPLSSKYLDPVDSPLPIESYSEENISSWVDFSQESYVVNPQNTTDYVLSNGVSVNAAGKVTYYIRVPQDAEPGWHTGAIAINPSSSTGNLGYSAQAQAITVPNFAFNVKSPENPERRLEVVDARGIRTGENTARIDIRVANRGTVTTGIRGGNVDIVNRETGEVLTSISVGYYLLEPSQSRIISSHIRTESLEQGAYSLNGSIDYSSSKAFVGQQTFALSSQIQASPEDPSTFNPDSNQSSDDSGASLWLMVLFVVVMSAVMYSFGFDPFWIVVAAGFIVIGLFILVSPVSNWMLLVLLTTPVIILYYA